MMKTKYCLVSVVKSSRKKKELHNCHGIFFSELLQVLIAEDYYQHETRSAADIDQRLIDHSMLFLTVHHSHSK